MRVSGKNEPVISPPYHTTYFTPKTLDAYLRSFGLTKIHLDTMIFSEDRFFRRWSAYTMGREAKLLKLAKQITRAGFKLLFRPLFFNTPLFNAGYQIHYCYRKP
jgi:hypothetical protein